MSRCGVCVCVCVCLYVHNKYGEWYCGRPSQVVVCVCVNCGGWAKPAGDAFPWTVSLSQFSVYTLLGQQRSLSLLEPMGCTSTLAVTSHKLQQAPPVPPTDAHTHTHSHTHPGLLRSLRLSAGLGWACFCRCECHSCAQVVKYSIRLIAHNTGARKSRSAHTNTLTLLPLSQNDT